MSLLPLLSPCLSFRILQHIPWQAQTFLQRVLNVIGEDPVDRVGLVAGQSWETVGLAVGAREFEDRLDHAQEARIDGGAIVGGGFAVSADDPAARGGEPRRLTLLNRKTASDAGGELHEVTRFSQQIELKGKKRL